MPDSDSDLSIDSNAEWVQRSDRMHAMKAAFVDGSTTAATLDRAWLCSSYQEPAHRSAWRSIEARRNPRPTFEKLMLRLVGHLLVTTFICLTLFALAWSSNVAVAWLNDLHPFSDEDLKLISRLKTLIFYSDALVCVYMLLMGARNYCKEILR